MVANNPLRRPQVLKTAILLCTAISFFAVHAEKTAHPPADPPKTYRNPLLEQWDMADPDVLRVGNKYYLYPTSHGRGFDALESEDLVNWSYRGRVFDDPRGGDWAPDVFHDQRGDGKFYLYYTDSMTNATFGPSHKQVGVAVASDPLGPFTDKAVLAEESIDGHLFQDDDGKYYFYYVNIDGGFKIMGQPMSDPIKKTGEPIKLIWPTEPWEKISGEVTEGPFMLKHNGTYYLMFSGTGADSPNYGIGYATSKSPLGPFEKYKGNPIVHRDEKVLGPGHHCVVEGPDQKLWMIYHQKRSERTSFYRFLAIDPIWFDEQGILHAKATIGTDEPAPLRVADADSSSVKK